MSQQDKFGATWGTALKWMTAISAAICVGISLIGISTGPPGNIGWILGMTILPLAIVTISALFTIRGYVLTAQTLFVQRLGWKSRLDLTDLASAEPDPGAMAKSIRTCGNGGMFCIAGAFYNKKLGGYRAFATDPKRSVVLKFRNRTVVVTPDRPDEFVEKIKKLRNL